jgi:hypothetical protein
LTFFIIILKKIFSKIINKQFKSQKKKKKIGI